MSCEERDSVLWATIPSEQEEGSRLHQLVVQHMVHGPCGLERPSAPCMVSATNRCSKRFSNPKVEAAHYKHYSHLEVVTWVKNVKYLFKYILKAPDLARIGILL